MPNLAMLIIDITAPDIVQALPPFSFLPFPSFRRGVVLDPNPDTLDVNDVG